LVAQTASIAEMLRQIPTFWLSEYYQLGDKIDNWVTGLTRRDYITCICYPATTEIASKYANLSQKLINCLHILITSI
jgi:hypothetical protein